jgi:hypothetical protein
MIRSTLNFNQNKIESKSRQSSRDRELQRGSKVTSLVARFSRGRCAQHLHDTRVTSANPGHEKITLHWIQSIFETRRGQAKRVWFVIVAAWGVGSAGALRAKDANGGCPGHGIRHAAPRAGTIRRKLTLLVKERSFEYPRGLDGC